MTASTILVVDDEPVIREFLARVLENAGYTVQRAANGREALRHLETSPFDLLLTDIKMEHLDGVELLAEARSRRPDLAVILLTGYATVQSAVAALRHGAANYLLKPIKNEDLLAAVASALEARTREQHRDRAEAALTQVQTLLQQVGDTETGVSLVPVVSSSMVCGLLRLDTAAYIATLNGRRLDLTPTEFRLLVTLVQAPGAAIEYVKLVQMACGYLCTRQEAREIIGTHVLNLRQKMGISPGQPLHVESVRSVGYRLIPPE
ncbi:MAG: response regulator [Aggregatilineales bacterium]